MSYRSRRRRSRIPYVPTRYVPYGDAEPEKMAISKKITSFATKQTLRRFESTTDYLATCGGRTDGESFNRADSFTSMTSLPQAQRMGREGWPEGRTKVEKLTGALVAYLSSRIMREEWAADVEGHFFDLGLILAGEPEYWMKPENIATNDGTTKRQVRILQNGSVSGAVPVEVIEKRGAAIAALCDLLELAGHYVVVDLVFCTSAYAGSSVEAMTDIVRIKGSNERVDLDKMMFWLAHPAALRKLAFASWEGSPEAVRKTFSFYSFGGYGMPCDPIIPEDETPEIYMGHGGIRESATWLDPKMTEKWLESTLENLGVKLAPKGGA